MGPTVSELVDAWVTLALLKDQAIAGAVVHPGFDTFTACGQAQQTIEVALAEHDDGYMASLWAALDERKAEAHA